MEKGLLSSLRKRALGYDKIESIKEYSVDANGKKKLEKVKESRKYFPPEHQALRLLLEIDSGASVTEEMTDEELRAEKKRLIELLKEMY